MHPICLHPISDVIFFMKQLTWPEGGDLAGLLDPAGTEKSTALGPLLTPCCAWGFWLGVSVGPLAGLRLGTSRFVISLEPPARHPARPSLPREP